MAKSSTKGLGLYGLEFSLDGVNWNSTGTRYDTKEQARKEAQTARRFLPSGTQFRAVVSSVHLFTDEELDKVRTRKSGEEISADEMAPRNSKKRPSAE